jgi:RNA polymerase sigma-70 factor (ECF subfamily)
MPHQTDELSDSDIILRTLSGDVNIFEELIMRYQAHVFSIVRKHIPASHADEIAHDVFVRAYQGLRKFSQKSGFKQWLSGIAVRSCYDFWRKKYRAKEVPISQLSDAHHQWIDSAMAEVSDRAGEALDRQREATEILDAALSRLSAADRMVLELVYLEGHSHKEAADLLGWTVANIKIRAFRARKKLHKTLVEDRKHHQGAI